MNLNELVVLDTWLAGCDRVSVARSHVDPVSPPSSPDLFPSYSALTNHPRHIPQYEAV